MNEELVTQSAVDRRTYSTTDRRRWTTLGIQAFVGTSTAFIYLTNIWIGPLNAAYGWDFSTIALTFTLISLVGMPASIVAGKFRDRFGSRVAIRVGGIGYGISILVSAINWNVWFFVIGMGVFATFFMYFAYLGMLANVGELFPDRRGLALGFAVAATNIGGALIAPLAEWMVRLLGVSLSIAVQGVVYGGVIFLCSWLIVEAPRAYRPSGWTPPVVDSVGSTDTRTASLEQIDRDVPWYRLLRTASFWLFFVAVTLISVGLVGFSSNMSLLAATSYGVDSATGAWFYTVFALGMGFGALIVGVISDRFGPLATIGAGSLIAAAGLLALVLEGLQSTSIFLIVIVFAGVILGGSQTVLPNVLMTAFGTKNFGINFGILMLAAAIASFTGSQLAVLIAPSDLFIFGIITSTVGGLVAFLTRVVINRRFGFKVIR